MKKVLSLVLALAMVLGCFSTVFAKEFADVAADADCHDAVAVLSDLGVCSGKSETSFDPEGIVNRAEMAAFIINALGITPTANATTKFTDVASSKWYSGYVAYANSLGIISGRTATTFDPEAQVSYDEAITMLINALGYTADSLTGTYPAAYVSKAKTLGILEGVDSIGTAKANRGDIAIMLYNTLDEAIGHVDKDGAWTPATPVDNMFKRLGATLVADSKGEAIKFVVTEDDVAEAVADISAYLGAVVTAYVNKDGEIVAIYEVDTESVTAETNDDATKFGDYKLSKVAGEEVAYFVNGEYTTTAAIALDPETTYTINGTFSGNYVTEAYSVLFWKANAEFAVTETMLKKLASDKNLNGNTFAKTNTDEIDTAKFTLVGVDSLDAIKKDDVVTVYKNQAGNICKLEVSDKTETGKVTKISGDKYTINGVTYELDSAKLAKLTDKPTSFSAEYVISFNYAGDIFDIEVAEEDTTECYAALIDLYTAGESKNWSSETAKDSRQIKVLDADGTENTYIVDEDAKPADLASIKFDKTDDLNTIIKYTLNEDGEVCKIEKVLALTTTSVTVSKSGTIAGKYINDDAAIFQLVDAAKYTWKVVKLADIIDSTLTKGAYKLDDNGRVAVIASDSTTSSNIYGFYVGKAQVGTDKYEVTFLVDGVETVYTAKTATTFAAAKEYGKITVSTNEVKSEKVDPLVSEQIATGASIKNNTLIIDGNATSKSYSLDKNVAIYCYDESDKEVTVSNLEDLEEVAVSYYVYLYRIDTTDTYDVVVFTQK